MNLRYVLLLFALSLFLAPAAQAQVTFIVNAPLDGVDPAPGDGVCEVEVSPTACSFRAALQEANALPGIDFIHFDEISSTAVVTLEFGPLPAITETVVIDGYTAPDYDDSVPEPEAPAPTFYIDGANLTASNADGLVFVDGSFGSKVRGLGIINFPDEGIQTRPGAGGITVQGCWVGVDANEDAGPNGDPGFENTAGILLQSDGNDIGQRFEGGVFTGRGNVVAANAQDGISIDGGDDNRLRGNLVGLVSDARFIVNYGYGVRIHDGTDNGIGGFTTSERAGNTISFNDAGGVRIDSDGNFLRGNYIGTGPNGEGFIANGGHGVELRSAGNVVGGHTATARNVIAASQGEGLLIDGPGNLIRNNHIGINAAGTDALGNKRNGIKVEPGADDTTIRDNLVGGNGSGGVHSGIIALSDNNTIRGNLVGTNADGADLGNTGPGVQVAGSGTLVGGTEDGAGNVIGFNSIGIFLGAAGSGNTVQSNFVGTNAEGDDLGNDKDGISIETPDNLIGSATSEAGNAIAHNGLNGVRIFGDATDVNNHVAQNAIFANAAFGIDLGTDGSTPNDPGDGDTGPNNLQNYPEITSADYDPDADEVTVTYHVDTDPANAVYPLAVDFYLADADAQEGHTLLTGTTLGPGAGSYTKDDYDGCGAPPCEETVTITPAPELGISRADLVLATATDADGNTSEFSAPAVPLPVELVSFDATVDGEDAVLTWKTASETNNDGFAVERRANPQSEIHNPKWTEVGFVEGAGTTTEPQSYAYRARGLDYGAHVFRLRQIDRDGTASYSEEVEAQVTLAERYALSEGYPNPFRQRATLELAVREAQEVRVEVYDVLGRRVEVIHRGELAANETHRFTVEASGLSSGLYLLRVTGEEFAATRRLVLVR